MPECVLAKSHREKAHVTEWERRHGPIPPGHFIAHPCGNTLCIAHMKLVGYQRTSPSGVLNEDDKLRIKELFPQMRHKELAEVFGVKVWTVQNVVRGSRYAYKGGISDRVRSNARDI